MVIANGDDSGRAEGDPEPCTKLEGFEVSAGMGWEDHSESCPNYNEDAWQYFECDCETREFTWSHCEGCADILGGSRYAVTVWAPFGARINPHFKSGGSFWLDYHGNPLPS
jgi:hypothetical protein